MFSTGQHFYLYIGAGFYLASFFVMLIRVHRMGAVLFFSGFVIHTLYLVGRAWLGGVFIPNAIFEGPFFLPWCLSLMALVNLRFKGSKRFVPLLVAAILFTLFSIFYTKGMIPPTPRKITVWALFFFASESFAHAFFYGLGIFTCIGFVKKEPVIKDSSWIVWGLILYTIAQVTGAVWCFLGWGNTFSWGARHLSSAAIWTFYVGVLHLKFIPEWKRKTFFLEIFGAVFVLFISYGHYLHEMRFSRIGG